MMAIGMRVSDDPHYLSYMNHFASGNYPMARRDLEQCLKSELYPQGFKAYFLRSIGMTYFHEGNHDKAREYYVLSEQADFSSLLPQYYFAKFLAEKLGDYEEAIAKCEKMIGTAMTSPFPKTEEEFSSDYYLLKATQLKEFCVLNKNTPK